MSRGPSSEPVFAGPYTGKNRPDMMPREKGNILFADAGSTGWGRIRRLGTYKEDKGWSEKNFSHLDQKWSTE